MRKPWVHLVCLVLPLLGCARVQTFRVVDAQTGQPIHGVQVERIANVARSGRSTLPEALNLPVEVSSTNAAGMATFNGPAEQFVLKKDGYEVAQAETTFTGIQVRYEGKGPEVSAQRIEGIPHIALRRQGAVSQSAAPTVAGSAPAGTRSVP